MLENASEESNLSKRLESFAHPALWNPFQGLMELRLSRFRHQSLKERFSMAFKVAYGDNRGQMGVMDYLLVFPVLSRLIVGLLAKKSVLAAVIAGFVLLPFQAIVGLVNLLVSAVVVIFPTLITHGVVQIMNAISRRRADSLEQIEVSGDTTEHVPPGFQRLSSVPNTGSMTAEEYEANLAADTVSSAPTIVTYGYGRTGANPLSFSVGNGLGTSSAAAANPRGDASTATLRR